MNAHEFDISLRRMKGLDSLCFLESRSPEIMKIIHNPSAVLPSIATEVGVTPAFLCVNFKFHTDLDLLPNLCEDDEDEDESNGIAIDEHPPCTVTRLGSSNKGTAACIHGQIHWLLHPTYQVICPFVHFSDMNGSPLRSQHAQILLAAMAIPDNCMKGIRLCSGSGCVAYETEANLEKFTWSQEEHPLSGFPCWCLHICELPAKLMLMLNESKRRNENQGESSRGHRYILTALSLLAPIVGLQVSSGSFRKALEDLHA